MRFAYRAQCAALCCADAGRTSALTHSMRPQQDTTGICGFLVAAAGAITSGCHRIKLSPRTQIQQKGCMFLLPSAWRWTLDRASKPTETWHETLGSCALVFSAFSRTTNQVALTTAFLKTEAPGLFMRLWNPLDAPSLLASPTWRQHLRHTLPCVVGELGAVYLLTGFYLNLRP